MKLAVNNTALQKQNCLEPSPRDSNQPRFKTEENNTYLQETDFVRNKMQIGLFFFSTAFLAASIAAIPSSDSAHGRLQIIEVGKNTLEAIFYEEETGIRIRADSTSLTLISMANDEVLLSGSKPHDSSLLTSVMGSSFLKYATTTETGEKRKVEFIVPESLVDEMKLAVEAKKEERLISQLNGDQTETHTIQGRAFERFFARPELALLGGAATALGEAGVMGYENQGALNFYAVASAVLKAQHRENEEGSAEIQTQYEDSTSRFKRLFGYRWCRNAWRWCRRCPIGDNCLGRCGPGCWWCWWIVCGNCCFNQGCYDHDICCEEHGSFSTECLIPIPFSCSGYSCHVSPLVEGSG